MKNKYVITLILSGVISLIPIFIFSANLSDTKKEIGSLFATWNSSLQTGDPDKITINYAADAVLLPTVSKKVRYNHKEIKDYFEHHSSMLPEKE